MPLISSDIQHPARAVRVRTSRFHAAGIAIVAAISCSGCHVASRFAAPGRLEGTATASPLPPAWQQPPVEPPAAPPAQIMIEPPLEPPPVPPAPPETALLREEIEQLRAELRELNTRQEQSQTALESLTASSTSAASRSAALEAHLALQSSLIDDLRTATQQQQRQQWKALDAVSEGIDRLLKQSTQESGVESEQAPPGTSPAPAPRPLDMPLEEIISRQPDGSSGRKLQ